MLRRLQIDKTETFNIKRKAAKFDTFVQFILLFLF